MSLIKRPEGSYRDEIKKGRFYRCPATFPFSSLVIVRPLNDDNSDETIPADIIPSDKLTNPFDHTPFSKLQLKADEEFALVKMKMRRVLAITKPDENYGLVKLAPIYTYKDYHDKRFEKEKLINNQYPGIIYLKECNHNKEGFVSLMESFSIQKHFLEPLPLELSSKGIELLDDNLVLIHDIYSESI